MDIQKVQEVLAFIPKTHSPEHWPYCDSVEPNLDYSQHP